jgi:predicted ATPase/DNA-binding SARP family transcriptional activator/Flp pilus assembly protein TadD
LYDQRVEFRILGPLEVSDGDHPVAVAGAKPRALLAALLIRSGQTVSAGRLIDELWGDDPPETAQNTLQVYVSQLRRSLGPDLIVRRSSGYALAAEREQIDLARFEDLVESARNAEPHVAADRLREALALWRGEPELDGARLGELRLTALEARIDADLALGRHATLVPELQALVADEPLRERLRAQLLLALYRDGRQADALAEYARARKTLVDELGIEPGADLQRAHRAVLAHADDAPQVAHTRSLPVPTTPFVGRQTELAAVSALIGEGARLITLTGPGGIGKTRLALEAARAANEHATFVPLASVADSNHVEGAIQRALNTEEDVSEHLRARSALLLLDNFEQVLDAAPLVSSLVQAAPGLRVLVTSRSVLRVAGEREYEVPPLGAGPELFLQRAVGEVDDLESVQAICDRLDGLPLAIELAAARTKLLPPRKLLERLESRLELLTAGSRDAPERQRTMRATVDWSYRLLDSEEQVLFARLAVFSGGATVEQIEEVCNGDLDLLASLLDKSLLRRRGERVVMLETLREYAGEQLRALGEEDVLRDRHLASFVRLATEAEPHLDASDQEAWYERLEAELPNIRAALAHAIAKPDPTAAAELAGRLQRLWQVHGHLGEGEQWLEASLAAGEPPVKIAGKAWNGLGIVRADRGDYAGARTAFERALELRRDSDDEHGVASTLNNLGALALFREDYEGAHRAYEQALAIMRRREYSPNLLAVLENIGGVALVRGDVAASIEALEEGQALAVVHGEHRAASSTARWLARALIEQGELERSKELLAESLALAEQIGHRQGVACALDFQASWAHRAGDEAGARRLLEEGAAVWASIGAVRPADVALLSPPSR